MDITLAKQKNFWSNMLHDDIYKIYYRYRTHFLFCLKVFKKIYRKIPVYSFNFVAFKVIFEKKNWIF